MATATKKTFTVISWNVLHLVHEINYVYDSSPVIDKYSIRENWLNEKLRINDMAVLIIDLLKRNANDECFICLQEVPGDLIPLLKQMFDSHLGSVLPNKPLMHIQTYPRIPKINGRQGPSFYDDINESLVTIHSSPRISSSELARDRIVWTPCPNDKGKGALTVVTASGLTIVNTHVPFNKDAALSLLTNFSWPTDNSPFVLVGDINCDSKSFIKLMKQINQNQFIPIAPTKATRVGYGRDGNLHKSSIDHYLISASLQPLITSPTIVYDEIGDISDHYPISLSFSQ